MFKLRKGKREMFGRNLDSSTRPRMLLAYTDAAYASACGRHFRRLGWEVQMVASSGEARELAGDYRPDVVVLDAALLDESGWLTSAKISTENPELQIVVVADQRNDNMEQRLRMVGADRAVCRQDGAEALAESIFGKSFLSEAV